jgi:geranylgeranyl reductase family protein
MSDPLDLLIVGAGPGGSSAAAAALRGGLSVLQLDAARFPRVKPCAGGLTPKSLRPLPCALGGTLRGTFLEFEFNAWRGARSVYSFRAPLLTMVARPELDQRLVEANRAHERFRFHDAEGVRALEHRAGLFHVWTTRRELRARQLIGADGANGVVNRTFVQTAPRGRAVALELVLRRAGLENDPVARPCFDFGAVPRGYGWVFPKDDQVSVGLYSLARGRKDLRALLRSYLEAKGFRWRGKLEFEAHTIPLGGHRVHAHGPALYVVGDAAGFADALTGEGIYHALESGRIAGELAAEVARGAASPDEYARRLEPSVLGDTRWSWRVARLFYARPDLSLWILRRTPLGRALVQGTGSGATFRASLRDLPRLAAEARAGMDAGVRSE